MAKKHRSLITAIVALLVAPALALGMGQKPPKRGEEPPKLRSKPRKAGPANELVLLELFTSQGCSSCPRADDMLRALLKDPQIGAQVVPLSLHVDYWDGLGWKDPFSEKRWSTRQRAYASRKGRQQVATPQVVLDGYRVIPANNVGLLRAGVERLGKTPKAGRIEIAVQDAKLAARVSINAYLRRDVRGRMVDVVVALYEDGVTTEVERGENAGRALRNDRVVRYMQVVDRIPTIGGSLCRKAVFVPLPPNWKGRRFGVVAFLQSRPSLKVHGAARIHFGFTGDIPAHTRKTPAHKSKSILHQPL